MVCRQIPCILKYDALQRNLVSQIAAKLSERVNIIDMIFTHLSREEVIKYKSSEWDNDSMGVPEGFLRECILDYEASDVAILKLSLPLNMTYVDLQNIKGLSFLPSRCKRNSIRGFFADNTQKQRLVLSGGRILERISNDQLGFPRNIIHIPSSADSVAALQSIVDLHARRKVETM